VVEICKTGSANHCYFIFQNVIHKQQQLNMPGQGFGSCNVSVSSHAHNISVLDSLHNISFWEVCIWFCVDIQWLLSLYLVGAACAQWNIGGGEFDKVVDQNSPPIFYYPLFLTRQTTPLTKLFPYFIPLFFKAAPLTKIPFSPIFTSPLLFNLHL